MKIEEQFQVHILKTKILHQKSFNSIVPGLSLDRYWYILNKDCRKIIYIWCAKKWQGYAGIFLPLIYKMAK